MQFRLVFIFLLFVQILNGQNHYNRFESVDIQHYIFEIHLNDTTNRIEGKATLSVKFLKPAQNIQLDFIGMNDSIDFGMKVEKVISDGNSMNFTHKNDQLFINFDKSISKNTIINFEVKYSGIPGDGLIISRNKYNNRTFFGDNWPNRARFWLPTVDHPSDKATLEFLVYAPEQYRVVSNGFLVEEINLGTDLKLTHWKENIPISTKLMVIGVAQFSIKKLGEFEHIPVSCWVFPQNREEGFDDFSIGMKPLQFYSGFIGPYSYEKLAHVQSKTMYGGMENASCIFYAERTVTGKQQIENLIAHETAHQWFGNSVTEQNWHHVWLSEGFATYLTLLYNQQFYGDEIFKKELIKDREQIIDFSKTELDPIIDTTITDYNQLLNVNSYQKASWFLHMLRNKIGEDTFQKCIQNFYMAFKDSTALTSDFQKITENTSGQNLESFFHEWLLEKGFPVIHSSWNQNRNGKLTLKISQEQNHFVFDFPLEIKFIFQNGESRIEQLHISSKNEKFSFNLKNNVHEIILDPEVKLLFDSRTN